jgi:hypothetical protein
VIEQAFACRLNVTEADVVRVSGLQRKWPKRVTRYLAPLDFKQQADRMLQDLFVTFEQVSPGKDALELGAIRC